MWDYDEYSICWELHFAVPKQSCLSAFKLDWVGPVDNRPTTGYCLEKAQVVGIVGIVGIVGMVGIVGINK